MPEAYGVIYILTIVWTNCNFTTQDSYSPCTRCAKHVIKYFICNFHFLEK